MSSTTKIKNTLTSSIRDGLIVDCYIRHQAQEFNLEIPPDIIKLFYDWYHLTHEYLKFSKKYQTREGWDLTDDNMSATRTETVNYHAYIAADVSPVFNGSHCWRVYTKIKNKNKFNTGKEFEIKGSPWIGWFVGSPRMFKPNSFIEKTVWGISNASQYYVNGQYTHSYAALSSPSIKLGPNKNRSTAHFKLEESCTDILLNCDKGTLKFCVVGNCSQDSEKGFVNLPIKTDHGWIPHINVYYISTYKWQLESCRIAKIPIELYGLPDDAIFKLQKILPN